MRNTITRMRVPILQTLAILLISSLVVFTTIAMKAKKRADDVWKQLGITLPQANMDINYSFNYGVFDYTGAKNAKNIAPGDRVAIIGQLVAYAKKYYNSNEFRTAYGTYRKGMMPQPPVSSTETAETIKAMEKLRLERNLKTAEEGLNSTNPKVKNGAPMRIENVKKELAALDDPNNATIKRRLADNDRSYQYAVKLYGDKMTKFNQDYPEDPKGLLKTRLQQMLDITADVDYGAELKDAYNKKFFVNPLYERKPAAWKLAFRAGKATTDAVRAEATKWLSELQ